MAAGQVPVLADGLNEVLVAESPSGECDPSRVQIGRISFLLLPPAIVEYREYLHKAFESLALLRFVISREA